MESEFVTLEQAQRLDARGFKGEFPQMVYRRQGLQLVDGRQEPRWVLVYTRDPNGAELTSMAGNTIPHIAAPTYLRALEWLEREKGWHFYRNIIGWWNVAHRDKEDLADDRIPDPQPTASALLDAILDRLEAATT